MNILILGSGGREHSLAWKLSQSNKSVKLYIAPGNAGTSDIGENININPNDFESIKNTVLEKSIDMVIVGPEDPLVKGIYDYFINTDVLKQIPVIGPSKSGAMLEGSKEFAKIFMQKNNIPTASYKSFMKETLKEGINYLRQINSPYVLKADGLAAGKGVVIHTSLQEAENELDNMLNGKFGEAGKTVVIEEFLDGIEVSFFVVTDGKSYKLLPEAKDYKRIGENDTGLNTGGMGAISPVPFVDEEFFKKVETRIIKPTIEGLKKENIVYKGFIFFGLINVKGNPFVIEYNVRLGDPEAEVTIPRIKTDLVNIFECIANQTLDKIDIEIIPETVSTVMLVSKGYPLAYEKNKVIFNLKNSCDSIIFHAGTKRNENDILTNGGRVLAISSYGNNINDALKKSYKCAEIINFEGKHYRKDIGFDLK
ncbi:MAG: phosphoribosylamine--glycine ligase [Bacteroidales bacterium]|nr:phosphoribosylamine--glycine ligase [Bacteroidales bacterium]